MMRFYNNIKKYIDFVPPIFIFTLLFISNREEIEHHALKFSVNISITIFLSVIFYLIILNNERLKLLAVIVCLVSWFIFAYFKTNYLPFINHSLSTKQDLNIKY